MTLRSIILAGTAVCLLASPASAGTGWYLGLGAGWAMPDSVDGRIKPANVSGSVDFKDNIRGMASLGYKWDNNFRLEIEGAFSSHDVDRIHALGLSAASIHGSTDVGTVMANAAYDLPLGSNWALTFGGGAGWGWVDPDIGNSSARIRGSDDAFAWQLFGGLAWTVSDDVDLDLTYRYASIGATDHATNFPGPQTAHVDKFAVQSVMLGLRWYPSAEAPPPPVPVPPPPPPPPPVAPKVFIVFFDFDKSNLTAEAQAVVSEAVNAVKNGNIVHVMITGHTDTVGSHEYNQALSERRAASVKAEMIRLGVSDGSIGTVGKSFDDPMVQTGPGVREPQNRRALIEFGS